MHEAVGAILRGEGFFLDKSHLLLALCGSRKPPRGDCTECARRAQLEAGLDQFIEAHVAHDFRQPHC